ncbi:hypothetical protein NX02_26645 [Sphingomonas sanxanigenens DSM 19645 = NX02]|uniref:Pyrroline-5-carboxylate reductase catalytic N-terminal domain-containing protein n=1 Tax=Sphingomonas sanxanigenens DSM 19645 = NX02 TaxID=1123269 RepID=W0AMI0_9SPHN|nr:hypothetical protein NX02_26645 [Sphingomonas sanxanigenens DSM 19645 = NX02]
MIRLSAVHFLVNGNTWLKDRVMTIGIIGAGNIGGAFAKAVGKAGIEAVIANSRGPDSIAALVSTYGGAIRAGTVKEAAAQDMVLVALEQSEGRRRLPIAVTEEKAGGGPGEPLTILNGENSIL